MCLTNLAISVIIGNLWKPGENASFAEKCVIFYFILSEKYRILLINCLSSGAHQFTEDLVIFILTIRLTLLGLIEAFVLLANSKFCYLIFLWPTFALK